ncbi:MAG: 16S rRNA (cytidine(1402)-2'-O)-methyltransferase [Actinobacteria bacterium]|nr:16S rRNA (cytidine(1402)-2'-O)-methyltransferase [Actinomycetota bacterium]
MSLILAATPLGNPGDASARLREAIESAGVIAAEDSRKFHRLCQDLQLTFSGRVISFFEGNEIERTPEILQMLQAGENILVVSDAGMPTISDPGFRLMRDAIAQGIDVSVIPGPSAVTMALALSGLPTDRFTFEGFSPRAAGARKKFFEVLEHEERTVIWFEAPHRLEESLVDAVSIFGTERPAVICREMTKRYEETIRGTLEELVKWSQTHEVLGEITIVLAGAARDSAKKTASQLVERVKTYEEAGMDRKSAIATVADEYSVAKRVVFAAVVDAKSTSRISP